MKLFYGHDMFDVRYTTMVGAGGANLIISSVPLILQDNCIDDVIDVALWCLDENGLFLLDSPDRYEDLISNMAGRREDIHLNGMIRVQDQYPDMNQTFFVLAHKRSENLIAKEMRGDPLPRAHPREFDRDIIGALIGIYSNRKECVLDFFCGTGAVPIMADRLGRIGIGIDNREIERIIA